MAMVEQERRDRELALRLAQVLLVVMSSVYFMLENVYRKMDLRKMLI
jgi:hypothetical protein